MLVVMALAIAAAMLAVVCAVGRLFGGGQEACRRLARVRCQIRQLLFRIRNCRTGNDDPCLGL